MLRLALRGARHHAGRLLLSGLAVVLGVSFMTASFVVTDSLRSIFDGVVRAVNAEVDLVVRTEAGPQRAPVGPEALEVVRSTPGVASAAAFVGGFVQVVAPDGRPVDPAAGAPLALTWPDDEALTPLGAVQGRRPAGASEVAVEVGTARDAGIEVGDTMLIAGRAVEPTPFTVVGIASFGGGEYPGGSALFAFDLATLQSLTGIGGAFDSILVDVEDGADIDEVRLLLVEQVPGERIEVVDRATLLDEGEQNIDDGLRVLQLGLQGFALVSVVVAAFLIVNTFGVVVAQRTRELGLLAAVGATPRQLFASVIAEAGALGGAASVAGIVVGRLGAAGLRSLLGVFELDLPAGPLPLRPMTIAVALGVGTGATVLAAASPARRAATVPPMAAIRSGHTTARRIGAGRVVLGAALVAATYGITTIGLLGWTGNAPATVGVAAVVGLTAVVVLGPSLAAAGAAAIRGHRSIARRLASDGVRRQPVRVAATASALAVGVSLVSGISVFGASATTSLSEDLAAGLRADLVVEADQFLDVGGFVRERIAALPEVAQVATVRQTVVLTSSSRELMTGIDGGLLPSVLDLAVEEGDLAALEAEPGVALQHDAARALDASVGDEIVLDFPLLGRRSTPVLAIYGNGAVVGGIVTTERLFVNAAGDQEADLLLVDLAEGVAPDAGRQAMADVLTDAPFVSVRTPAEYEAARSAQVDRLLALTAVLLGMAVAVAILGVANTVALSVLERRRELALLRAVGMTAGQQEEMIRWESVVIAFLGVAGGAALGIGLGAAFALSLSGAGVTVLDIPLPRIVAFGALGGVSAVTAAALPAARAARRELLPAMAVD